MNNERPKISFSWHLYISWGTTIETERAIFPYPSREKSLLQT